MTALHLRPRGFSELIDATFHIIRARFKALATVGALMMIPGAVMSLVLVLRMPDLMTATPGTMPTLGREYWTMFALVAPFSFALFTFGIAALIAMSSGAYLGKEVDVREAFATARRRFWPVLGAFFVKWFMISVPIFAMLVIVGITAGGAAAASGDATMAGAMAGGVGVLLLLAWMIVAPILLLRWAVSTPAAVLEPIGPVASLSRSAKLTKGSKGRLFVLYLVFFVVAMVAVMTLGMLGGLVGAAAGSVVVSQVLGNVMSLAMYPVLAVLQTVVYYDLRIRTEAYDLELMAQGLGADAALPAARGHAGQPA